MNLRLTPIVICILGFTGATFAHPYESVPCELALGLGHRATGLGPRGLLKSVSNLGAADLSDLCHRGIFQWDERIFVVKHEDDAHRLNWLNARLPSLPHAERHAPEWMGRPTAGLTSATDAALYAALVSDSPAVDLLSADPLQRGLYVIDRHVKLEHLEGRAREEFFATLPRRPLFELDDEGGMTRLDPDLVAERLDPAAMTLDRFFPLEPLHVVHRGFYAPRFRAVATLAAVPGEIAANRAIEISRFGDGLVAEAYVTGVRGREIVAAFEGHVRGDVLYMDAASYAPAQRDELKKLFGGSRDELLSGGIHLVDFTKVWEFHHEPWTHMVPR